MALLSKIVSVSDLSSIHIEQMFDLFSEYFCETNRTVFENDLAEKDQVILLFDENRKIKGFSTTKLMTLDFEGETIGAIFSGDTVVDQDFWGDLSLTREFVGYAARLKESQPATRLFWFLIVKGHRTFRYLPTFFRSFYPSWREPTPTSIQHVINTLAKIKFGGKYNSETGIVSFPKASCRLRSEIADIPEKDCSRPETLFFQKRNPDYRQGDELVCLAEIHEKNLKPFARRSFLKGAV